jgi:hypothetical protein
MTAISVDTDRYRMGEPLFVGRHPVAATTDIVAGAAIGVDPAVGYAVNMSAARGLRVLGVATKRADNDPGSAAGKTVPYETGVFAFANSTAGDAIAVTDVLADCFFVDNNTVAKTSNSGARPRAGQIIGMDGTKVLVMVGVAAAASQPIQTGSGTFVAGVLTVNAGITLTAESVIIGIRMTEGGTDGDEIRCPTADRTVGGPGTGAMTLRSFLSGVAATSDTSTLQWVIIG